MVKWFFTIVILTISANIVGNDHELMWGIKQSDIKEVSQTGNDVNFESYRAFLANGDSLTAEHCKQSGSYSCSLYVCTARATVDVETKWFHCLKRLFVKKVSMNREID